VIKIASGTSVRLLGQLGVDLTSLAVTFAFELVNPLAADSSGYVIGLGGVEPRPGNQTQTRPAVVVGERRTGYHLSTLPGWGRPCSDAL